MILLGLVGPLLALSGCADGGRSGTTVDMSTAQYTSVSELAAASEYLVTASIVGKPKPYTLPETPVLRYWVSDAKVLKVIGQRPDAATRLAPGMIIPIGTELLNSTQSDSVDNYSELATEFPTETDVPKVGDKIVAFLVHSDLAGYGTGYEAVGQATVGDATQPVKFRGLPGELNHRKLALARATDVLKELQRPAPWRQPDDSTETPVPSPPTGNNQVTPLAAPTSSS